MSTPRVQLSLTFDNVDFYYNYIKPVKDNREITPLIMRLLEAYFMDANVQMSVDSYGLEDVGMDDLSQGEFSEALAKAKETLAMMSVLSESAQDVLNDGMMSIEDMVTQVDEVQNAVRDMPDKPISVPQIETKSSETASPTEPVVEDERVRKLESSVEQLTSDMSELKSMFMQFMQAGAAQGVKPVQTEVPQEPEAQGTEVVMTDDSDAEEVNLFDSEPEPTLAQEYETIEEVLPSITEDEALKPSVSETPVRRSASDILADINATLGADIDTPKRPAIKAPIEDDIEDEESKEQELVEEPTVEQEDTDNSPIDGTNSLMSFLSEF